MSKNPELGIDMTPYLPTTPAHFATAFAVDDEWWQLHGADIAPRWQVWLAAAIMGSFCDYVRKRMIR